MGYLSPPPMPAPVVVYKDVGGLVTDYEAQTEQYRREKREVRLHECRSACTLALSLPNVCVYPDSKIKFHQAYNAITRETDTGVSAQLFASYPAAVQARLGYLTREYRVLSGLELIALGMRNCEGDNATMIAARRQPTPTRLASSRAAPGLAPASDFGDLAKKVQSAVASAFSGSPENPAPPIRIAVADRQLLAFPPVRPVPTPPTRPEGLLSEGAVSLAEDAAPETPLPPRRPPAEAFEIADAAAPALARNDEPQPAAGAAARGLMPGAQPILARHFVRTLAAK